MTDKEFARAHDDYLDPDKYAGYHGLDTRDDDCPNTVDLEEIIDESQELKKYFELVQNKEHWKNPIDSYCTASELNKVYEAIRFFTGTEPTFNYVGPIFGNENRFKKGDLIFKVRADGYRLGPAGDH